MISSLAPIMSRLSRWSKDSPEVFCAIVLFSIMMIHGATIGLTDDEAYYWVLAQKPALGYAYHPPMVAWMIALSQAMWGGLLGAASATVVRFPASLCAAIVLAMAIRWLRHAGVAREKIAGAAVILVSFAGLFALSWMMVPDLPLFLGWMLVFQGTWDLCFSQAISSRRAKFAYGFVFLGTWLACLSKYSAVLLALSAVLVLFLWASRERKWKGVVAIIAGGLLASVPILLWNQAHEWASILYQIRDRHEGGSLSLVRWARFWVIELFAGGPALIIFSFVLLAKVLRGEADRAERFLWIYAAPAALVFCLQPLWADFKPHWALVVWWPMALGLARAWALRGTRWATWQRSYGLALGAIVLICCHVPVVQYAIYSFAGERADPRLDVTNDLYGWRNLPTFLKAQPGNADLSFPVVGSRYQTASQAWFALGSHARVSLLPIEIKSRDEWPDLGISRSRNDQWPALTRPVFFVADNRYDSAPAFPDARCEKAGRVAEERAGHPAKWIDVWRCDPK